MIAPAQARAIDVLVLRDVAEQGLVSMERFADGLERGLASEPGLRVRSMTVREPRWAPRLNLGRARGYAARYIRYPLAAARQKADVYHVVDHGYGYLAAVLPRHRTVVSCHDLMLFNAAEGRAGFAPSPVSLARLRWSTSFLRSVAAVVAPTQSTKADIVRLRGVAPERVHVVPYGVDASFHPLTAEMQAALKVNLRRGARYAALHVSTGDPYKNVPATLHAIAALRGAGVDVRLVRAGRSLNGAERRLATSLGIDDFVLDLGRVTNDRLVELYNACDVFVFPSFNEGYGWPPIEAMACGAPVVVSDCPALMEVTGDAALHVPAGDYRALAAAMRRVLESEERSTTLRLRGRDRASMVTWRRTAEAFARVYREIQGGRDQACAA